MNNNSTAIIIGNSDGIGLALTHALLNLGWTVQGLSRRENEFNHACYSHTIIDVTSSDFPGILSKYTENLPDICVYCAGIGDELDLRRLERERLTFDINLMGAVKTIEVLLPMFIKRKSGHFIILSSIADSLISPEAPSYAASKAALSSYIEGLTLALKSSGVNITNVRFGFVETKMAKGEKMPMMISKERAVEHILKCMQNRPIRYSRPRTMSILVTLLRWLTRIRM